MGRRATSSARCIHCRMLEHLCVCALVPDLDLETRVMIVMHRREWSKSTATAPLARLALRNCEIRLRGQRDDPGSQRGERLVSCDIPTEQRQTLLLFPAPGAVMLTRELVAADPRPVMLVVPDGSWRQAAKITQREPVLAGLPRVVLPDTGPSRFRLRAEPRAGGLATYEAIARALRIIEGDEVGARLDALFDAMVERTLASRGRSRPADDPPPSRSADVAPR